MTSQIDPTKPTAGIAYTDDVRSNFAHAKAEIEALQSLVYGILGLPSTGIGDLMGIRDKAPTLIVNGWSAGGVTAQPTAANYNVHNASKILSGDLVANTYKELLTVTGPGLIHIIGVGRVDATNRVLGLKVVIDGVTVFDAVDAATASADRGMFAILATGNLGVDGTGSGIVGSDSMPFASSLSVWVKSNLSETDKVYLLAKYITVSA